MNTIYRSILILNSLMFVTHSLFSQVTTFQKMYLYTGNPYTECVATSDSGYVFSGVIGSGITRPCLIKINSVGDTVWSKRYMNNSAGLAIKTALLQTRDDGFIITSPEIIKTDASGNLLWARSQNPSWFGGDAVEAPNGDICAVGYGPTPSGSGMSVIKLDSSGNPLSNYYFGSLGDEPHSIRNVVSGGYIIAGTYEIPGGGYDGLLVRLSDSGSVAWSNRYHYAGDEVFYKVLSLSDGSFLALGTGSIPLVNTGIILAKIDSGGNTLWSRLYVETNTYAFDIYEIPGNRYLIAGSSNLSGNSFPGAIFNVDSVGNVLWYKKYNPMPGTLDAVFSSIAPALDGGYLLNGYTIGASGSYFYAVKTDSSCDNHNFCAQNVGLLSEQPIPLTKTSYPLVPVPGVTTTENVFTTFADVQTTTICSSVGIAEASISNPFEIYPNPVNDVLFVKNPTNEILEVLIYDLTGKKLLQQTLSESGEVDVNFFRDGMYFINLMNSRVQVVQKFIKLNNKGTN